MLANFGQETEDRLQKITTALGVFDHSTVQRAYQQP
jgi:hypothetical protein